MKISIREKDIGMFKAIDVSCKDGVIVLDFDCANCGVPMVNTVGRLSQFQWCTR